MTTGCFRHFRKIRTAPCLSIQDEEDKLLRSFHKNSKRTVASSIKGYLVLLWHYGRAVGIKVINRKNRSCTTVLLPFMWLLWTVQHFLHFLILFRWRKPTFQLCLPILMMASTGKYVLGIIHWHHWRAHAIDSLVYHYIYLLKGNNLWRFGWLRDSTYREVCEIIVQVYKRAVFSKKNRDVVV